MGKFVVSQNEWKYLIGAIQSPGSSKDINSEEFQSLENKKYIDFDFDGNISIDKELSELLVICLNSDKQISFTLISGQDTESVCSFYRCADEFVKLTEKDKVYTIIRISESDMNMFFDDLLQRFKKDLSEFPEKEVFLSDLNAIRKPASLKEISEAVKSIIELCGTETGSVILKALLAIDEWISIVSVEKRSDSIKIDGMVLLVNGNSMIEITPTVIGLENAVLLKGNSFEYVKNRINFLIA